MVRVYKFRTAENLLGTLYNFIIPVFVGSAWTKPATVDFGTDLLSWSMTFALLFSSDLGSLVTTGGKIAAIRMTLYVDHLAHSCCCLQRFVPMERGHRSLVSLQGVLLPSVQILS